MQYSHLYGAIKACFSTTHYNVFSKFILSKTCCLPIPEVWVKCMFDNRRADEFCMDCNLDIRVLGELQ